MSAEIVALALALVASLLGGLLLGRRRPTASTPTVVPPPPPTHTAVEHGTEQLLDEADIIDEVAAETDVPANDIDELVQLADDTRRRY